MPIPLYYAAEWKQIVTNSTKVPQAVTGFGLYEDGSPRIPEGIAAEPQAMAVIDDAVLPQGVVPEETLDTLGSYCKAGCCLDFLRPLCPQHLALIHGLARRIPEGRPFLLPAPYHSLAPSALCVLSCLKPCNRWTSFLEQAQQAHPSGWCLEVTPWRRAVPFAPGRLCPGGPVPLALCRCRPQGEGLLYYDTAETLRMKLTAAEAYNCRLAIGLLQELEALPVQ